MTRASAGRACSSFIPCTWGFALLVLRPNSNGVQNPLSTALSPLLVLPLAPGRGAFKLEKMLVHPSLACEGSMGNGRHLLGTTGVRSPPACPGPRPRVSPPLGWMSTWSSGVFLFPVLLSYS